MPGAATDAPSHAEAALDDRQLLARSEGLARLRRGRLLSLLLGLGVGGVLLMLLVQLPLNYPPERHLGLGLSALALAGAALLRRQGRDRAALGCLVGGIFVAVGLQALLLHGLQNAGLAVLPLLLLITAALLGARAADALLLAMISLLCLLSLREFAAPAPLLPAGLRALVFGLILLFVHAFLRGWLRAQARDRQALQALNERLHQALQRERALAAQNERLQRTLGDCRAAYAEALASQQTAQRLMLSALTPAPAPASPELPPSGGGFDLRGLLRQLVEAQSARMGPISLTLDLQPDVQLHGDAAALSAVVSAALQAALDAQPAQLQLRAGLLGLDVIDLELQALGVRQAPAALPEAERSAQLQLQGTLSLFDDEPGQNYRWRLLIPRVLS